jgi:pectinesterase inhibitor-like protein
MRLPTTLLAMATIALALSSADATIKSVCKAASEKDPRVNYEFCVSALLQHRPAPKEDTWVVAKQATDIGIGNAELAVTDIEGLLAKPETNAKTKAALEQCDGLYHSILFAFAHANEKINARNYTGGKEEAAKSIPLAHQCDDLFAKADVPSPLTQRSVFSVKIAIVCMVITDLIEQ